MSPEPARPASALLTDLYQINMAYALWRGGQHERQAVFDLFFRTAPCGNRYAIAAGLAQALDFVESFTFKPDDLNYLRSIHPYDAAFLDVLVRTRFTGEIDAVREGEVVFPHEPILRVRGPMLEAQLLETALLSIINHQTLIATKAARIVEAAAGDVVLEFGLRRAHGLGAGLYGARAAFIGGVDATSNVEAGRAFGIPVRGTHAHSYVQAAESELAAFTSFANAFPDNAVLLVDTYDTLRSGVPNATRTFAAIKARHGTIRGHGIRLDSGDLAYLSKESRRMLDDAGFADAKIVASSDLSEMLIRDLKAQGARIDVWGVGTHLITSMDCPALGGVYKLVAIDHGGRLLPRIKLSENPAKVSNPGVKKSARFYAQSSNRAILDQILLEDEPLPTTAFTAFDPLFPWKRKDVSDFTVRPLLIPAFRAGRRVMEAAAPAAARAFSLEERGRFAPEVRRLVNPHEYHVDLSRPLWELKDRLMRESRGA